MFVGVAVPSAIRPLPFSQGLGQMPDTLVIQYAQAAAYAQGVSSLRSVLTSQPFDGPDTLAMRLASE